MIYPAVRWMKIRWGFAVSFIRWPSERSRVRLSIDQINKCWANHDGISIFQRLWSPVLCATQICELEVIYNGLGLGGESLIWYTLLKAHNMPPMPCRQTLSARSPLGLSHIAAEPVQLPSSWARVRFHLFFVWRKQSRSRTEPKELSQHYFLGDLIPLLQTALSPNLLLFAGRLAGLVNIKQFI